MKTNILKVNDLFCGAGGMGLGFKQAGFRMAGAWDFDKWAVESYGNNVSPKVKQADVTSMTSEEVPFADVWTFGAPCQAFSIAGKQLGMTFKCPSCNHEESFEGELIIDRKTVCSKCGELSKPKDPRGIMFFEVMRLLKGSTDKPPVIMLENVKGIKKFLNVIAYEYEKRGYRLYETLYNSKYWGVPQNRERYFVVGVRNDIEKEFIFPYQQTDYIPKLSSILEENVDEKYYIDDEKALKIIEQAKEGVKVKQATKKGYDIAKPGDCINIAHPNSQTRRGRVGKQVAQTLMTSCEQVVVEPHTDRTHKIGGIYGKSQAGSCWSRNGVAPTLKTPSGGYSEPLILQEPKILVEGNTNPSGNGMNGNVYNSSGLAPTLTTNKGEGIKITDQYRIRKLTPREYARLQGFPDDFKFVVSNSQLYKQFGNAVTVNVAFALAKSIKSFLEDE